MAVTLTGDAEITYASFPIIKTETTEDGDLIVYGKATDGSVDSDMQIVDPKFAFGAIKHWKDTGANIRVQHNPQRDPAGVGIGVEFDGDATWVKSLICEPVAKKLVAKGALRAYSVGISRPTIERDPAGHARGGVITGGQIVEISLVDRPANKSCGIQLVKSEGDSVELVNEVFGTEEAISKAMNTEEVITKGDMADFEVPEPTQAMKDFTFTPNDLAKIVRDKIIEEHYSDLAAKAATDAQDAALLEEGDTAKVDATPAVDETAVPEVVKDQNGEAGPSVAPSIPNSKTPGEPEESPRPESVGEKAAKPMKPAKGKKGKKLPPWLNKPAADGDDCKVDHAHTEKCKTTPKEGSGAEEPADMMPAPVGDLMESPAKDHMKGADSPEAAAYLRFKTIGIDPEIGTLHDFTCAAYHPEEVAKHYPYADFSTLIDESLWQRKALAAATGRDYSAAMEAQQAWQSAVMLKAADPGVLNDWRLTQYKAFRDANPGPTSFPTPGMMSPTRFNRPNIGGGSGHSQDSNGYGAPNSGPKIPTSAPNAHSFGRPPLTAAHQSPSPSFMKGGAEYPMEQGVPTRITYAEIEKEKARRAVSMMHDHIMHTFPGLCPMNDKDAYAQEQPIPAPAPVGIGKSEPEEVVLGDVHKYIAKLEKKVRAGLITEDEARDKLRQKTAQKYAESIAQQVSKGLTSRSEILKAFGIEEPAPAAPAAEPEVVKTVTPDSAAGLTPDLMKSMMTEIIAPFQEKITAQETELAAYQQREAERDAQFKALLEDQQKNNQRWEDLANKADPGTQSWAGIALNPLRSPAGVVKQAEVSERVQGMMVRQLERAWRTSENPAEREAAYAALCKMQGIND